MISYSVQLYVFLENSEIFFLIAKYFPSKASASIRRAGKFSYGVIPLPLELKLQAKEFFIHNIGLLLPKATLNWRIRRTNSRKLASSYWLNRVVRIPTAVECRDLGKTPSVLVHVLVESLDQLDSLIMCLQSIPIPTNVCISALPTIDEVLIRSRLCSLSDLATVHIRFYDFRGSDITLMLQNFSFLLENADIVAQIRTLSTSDNLDLRGLPSYLLGSTFGSQLIVKSIINRLASNPNIGLMFSATYLPMRRFVQDTEFAADIQLLSAIEVGSKVLAFYQNDPYPTGSIFWCKGSLLRQFLDLFSTSHDNEFNSLQDPDRSQDRLSRILPAFTRLNGQIVEEFVLDDNSVGETTLSTSPSVIDCLYIDHNLGGGTRKYTNFYINHLLSSGHTVERLYYDNESDRYVLPGAYPSGGAFRTFADIGEVRSFLSTKHINQIVVNSLVLFPSPYNCIVLVHELKLKHGASLIYHVHDFQALCPSQHLLDSCNHYCAVPSDLNFCTTCAMTNSHMWHYNAGAFSIVAWRHAFQLLIDVCDQVVVFDESSLGVLNKGLHVPASRFVVRPHHRYVDLELVRYQQGVRMHVGVIGLLHHYKGIDKVNELASFIFDNTLDTPLSLVGTSPLHLTKNISVLGHYELNELPKIIKYHQITVFFIASIAPETFCYTLDELMAMNLPVVSYDLGAQGRRTAAYPLGMVIDQDAPIERVYEVLVAAHDRAYGIS